MRDSARSYFKINPSPELKGRHVRRMNVFGSKIFVLDPQNNKKYRIVEIYRPAELSRSLSTPPISSPASWFVTDLPMDIQRDSIAYGTLLYFKNPPIVE